jgi:hypothetical protein
MLERPYCSNAKPPAMPTLRSAIIQTAPETFLDAGTAPPLAINWIKRSLLFQEVAVEGAA